MLRHLHIDGARLGGVLLPVRVDRPWQLAALAAALTSDVGNAQKTQKIINNEPF